MAKNSYIRLVAQFLFPGILSNIASVVGLGAGLNSLFGGGSQNSYSAPQIYQPTGQGAADTWFQQLLQHLVGSTQGANNAIDPVLRQAFMKQLDIDPSGFAAAGQQAGQQYGQAAGLDQMFASLMGGQIPGLKQNEQQLQQAAFDPNTAMYNKELQQTIDTSRAADSARGIAMSPYSSGNESTAVQNFNTNWDYNQLARMLQGTQGYNDTNHAIGADASGASLLAGQVPGLTLQAGAAPITGQQQAAQFPANAATQYASQLNAPNSLTEQSMAQIMSYLSGGQAAAQNQYNAFSGQQQFGAGQQQGAMNGITQGLNQLGNSNFGGALSALFGGGGGGGGGGGQNYGGYVDNTYYPTVA